MTEDLIIKMSRDYIMKVFLMPGRETMILNLVMEVIDFILQAQSHHMKISHSIT